MTPTTDHHPKRVKPLYRVNAFCGVCLEFVILEWTPDGWVCEHCGGIDETRVWVSG
jgi:hypothetical protein